MLYTETEYTVTGPAGYLTVALRTLAINLQNSPIPYDDKALMMAL
jgi:hypothetical protein